MTSNNDNYITLDVKLDEKDTKWRFYHGEKMLSVPEMSSFGISEKDLQENETYKERLAKYKDKRDNVFLFSIACNVITSCLLYVPIVIWYDESLQHVKQLGWRGFPYALQLFGICPPLSFISPAFYIYLSLGFIWFFLFAKKPKPPVKMLKIEAYLKAINEHKEKNKMNRHLIPYNYDITKYASQYAIPDFIRRVIRFGVEKNRRIKEENLRAEQSFWFALSPYGFEFEVAKWFTKQGYHARVTPKSGDGGVDIELEDQTENKYYVQCKRYREQKVDRPTLQQLYGTVCADADKGIKGGIVVCLHGVTQAAHTFARKVGIKIYTINDLCPEDTLFEQRVKKELLDTTPMLSPREITIGNVIIRESCCMEEEDAKRILIGREIVISHRNLFFLVRVKPNSTESLYGL